MGTIDTFRDLVGNIADDAKEAFDDLLDRDDDWWDDDWWDEDCDWWDDDGDWEGDPRRRGRRRRSRRSRQVGRRGRNSRGSRRPGDRRVVEAGSRHPALAEPSRGAADPELVDQIRHLTSTVDSLRASLPAAAAATQAENRN